MDVDDFLTLDNICLLTLTLDGHIVYTKGWNNVFSDIKLSTKNNNGKPRTIYEILKNNKLKPMIHSIGSETIKVDLVLNNNNTISTPSNFKPRNAIGWKKSKQHNTDSDNSDSDSVTDDEKTTELRNFDWRKYSKSFGSVSKGIYTRWTIRKKITKSPVISHKPYSEFLSATSLMVTQKVLSKVEKKEDTNSVILCIIRKLNKSTDDIQSKLRREIVELHQVIDIIGEKVLDGMWDYNIDTQTVYTNRKFWKTFGYDRDKDKKQAHEWRDIIFEEDLPKADTALSDHLTKNKEYRVEVRYRKKPIKLGEKGDVCRILCRGQYMVRPDGTKYKIIGTHTDITELKKAIAREQQLIKEKAEFVKDISHELRNILNQIRGPAEILSLSEKTNSMTKKYSKIITENVDCIIRLINDLKSISDVSGNKFAIKVKDTRVGGVLKTLLNSMAKHMRDVHVKYIRDDNIYIYNKYTTKKLKRRDYTVVGAVDAGRLRQVLTTIISDAVKYRNTKVNSVVKIKEYINTSTRTYEIKISDNGLGIPKNKQHLLFKKFMRFHDTKLIQGSGLGLVLSKNFMQAMGGDLNITSEGENLGSCVTITINNIKLFKVKRIRTMKKLRRSKYIKRLPTISTL